MMKRLLLPLPLLILGLSFPTKAAIEAGQDGMGNRATNGLRSKTIKQLNVEEPKQEDKSLCKEVKNYSPNTKLRVYKGRTSNLFRALDCLPREETFIFINRKGQKKLVYFSRYKSLLASTYLIFVDQNKFYVHFTGLATSVNPFRLVRIDGEEYELPVKKISNKTNRYTLNKSLTNVFKKIESSFDLAVDPGFKKWSVKREIGDIKEYFLVDKSQWKVRSPILKDRSLPTLVISSSPLEGQKIFKNSLPSLVTVETSDGSGSGFLIDKDLIGTNSHVVNGTEDDITVITYDKSKHEATVVYDDELYDFAILRIQSKNKYSPLPICRAMTLQTGDSLFVLGSPGAAIVEKGYLENSITGGLVSSVRYVDEQLFIQTDAAMNPGNSGGPMVNKYGAVVGISTFKPRDQSIQGISFGGEITNILAESGLLTPTRSIEKAGLICGLQTKNQWAKFVIPISLIALCGSLVIALRRSNILRRLFSKKE